VSRALGRTDLTAQEQANVRAAIRFLRVQCGGVKPLTKALRCQKTTVQNAMASARNVTSSVAFRVARFAGVGVDDLLAGRFPPAVPARTAGAERWRRARRADVTPWGQTASAEPK
jgi:hypothetical protein